MSAISDNTLTGVYTARNATRPSAPAGLRRADLMNAISAAFPALIIAVATTVLAAVVVLAPAAKAQLAATATEDAMGISILPLAFACGAAAFAALMLTAICCLDATRNN